MHNTLLPSVDPGVLTEIAIEVLHLVLSNLLHSSHDLGVATEQKQKFLKKLKEGENKFMKFSHLAILYFATEKPEKKVREQH